MWVGLFVVSPIYSLCWSRSRGLALVVRLVQDDHASCKLYFLRLHKKVGLGTHASWHYDFQLCIEVLV